MGRAPARARHGQAGSRAPCRLARTGRPCYSARRGGAVTDKPSNAEEEYLARENAERMRRLAAEQKAALASTERVALKKRHWMRCPQCGMELEEIGFRGSQVDRAAAGGGP